MIRLSDLTPARVALGRAGDSLPTKPLLDFRLAHARARDTVKSNLDAGSVQQEFAAEGWTAAVLHTEARTREEFLRRPDLGRRLDALSIAAVAGARCDVSTAFVVCDGLSSLAVHRHALNLLRRLLPARRTNHVWIVQQGRVAVGDHIGDLLHADLSLVLIGERPGLSTPDSLGAYLTWQPHPGRSDAERNCVSNIHTQGLSYAEAAHKLVFLINEARRRQLTGVALKESAGKLLA